MNHANTNVSLVKKILNNLKSEIKTYGISKDKTEQVYQFVSEIKAKSLIFKNVRIYDLIDVIQATPDDICVVLS